MINFDKELDFFNEKLYNYIDVLSENCCFQKNVTEAMLYSLSVGGKRIRPILALEFCKLFNGDVNSAVSSAAALEMIHTFSLIHDDLPCMDDDDFRRGMPSCHKKFGEAVAVLAGDALESFAFEIIACDESLTAQKRIELIKILTKTVGALGIIGGQIIDIQNVGEEMPADKLLYMYTLKTATLISAACKMGAVCGGATAEQIELSQEYGVDLGLAFQIIDDILDVVGTQELLGKPIGSDADNDKFTFVTVNGIEKSREKAKSYTDKAMHILRGFENSEKLQMLTESLLSRKY